MLAGSPALQDLGLEPKRESTSPVRSSFAMLAAASKVPELSAMLAAASKVQKFMSHRNRVLEPVSSQCLMVTRRI